MPPELRERFDELLRPLELRPLELRPLELRPLELLPLDADRLRPPDELAALARPELEPLRPERLPPPDDESELLLVDLTSPSSTVPRHSPVSSSFIMM